MTDVTVNLTGGSGTLDAASVAHKGNDGYWVGDGYTNGAGTASTYWLAGTYDVRVDFRGQTNTNASVAVSGETTTTEFALTTITVNLTGGSGTLDAASMAHKGNDDYWVGGSGGEN